MMPTRRWWPAAILSAVFAAIVCAAPWIPDAAERWLLLPFVPHQVWVSLLTLALLSYIMSADPVGPGVFAWALLIVLTLPVSYLYVVVVEVVWRAAMRRGKPQ